MWKWRPPSAPAGDDWKVVYQIVVPKNLNVLELAHFTPMASHLGVNKTYSRIQTHFIGQVSTTVLLILPCVPVGQKA